MTSLIGQLLPLALGIAISPVPVIAVILTLFSPRARGTSIAFLAGWLAGILLATALSLTLAGIIPESDPNRSQPITGTIQILLGLGLVLLSARQWRSRPREDTEPHMPKWMGAMDSLVPRKAFGIGLLLSSANPKNLLMTVAAGVTIGTTSSGIAEKTVVLIAFAVVAALSVAMPVAAYLVAPDKLARPLSRLRDWLVANNSVVMAVLMLTIGVVLVGKGLGQF